MTASPDSSVDINAQISFARHNFDNLQNLIRFVDTKAAALITIVIFLAASGIQVAKDAVGALSFSSCRSAFLGTLFLCGCFGFLLSFTWISVHVQHVIKPRGARHYPEVKTGRDLMWQDHMIKHNSNTDYFDAVASASPQLLLRNITDQTFELSHISKEKMDAFHQARAGFWIAFCCWVTAIGFGMLLLRLK